MPKQCCRCPRVLTNCLQTATFAYHTPTRQLTTYLLTCISIPLTLLCPISIFPIFPDTLRHQLFAVCELSIPHLFHYPPEAFFRVVPTAILASSTVRVLLINNNSSLYYLVNSTRWVYAVGRFVGCGYIGYLVVKQERFRFEKLDNGNWMEPSQVLLLPEC